MILFGSPETLLGSQAVDATSANLPARADCHPAAVYLARLSPSSRRTMRCALDTVATILTDGRADADTLPWHSLRYQHTQAVRAVLAERYAPSGANRRLSALRGVLQEAWRLGLMSAEDYHRAADLPGVKGFTLPAGRALSAAEIAALFRVCAQDPSPAGARDAGLFAALFGAGLRRAEVCALDVDDYDPDTGALTVRSGKGRKDRISYLAGGGAAAMNAWIACRGGQPGALMCPVNKAGRITVRRITGQAVRSALVKRACQAGIDPATPHDLRRSFVSGLLAAGADLSTVASLCGHSSVTTTQRYDLRKEAAKRSASELLDVPYTDPHP